MNEHDFSEHGVWRIWEKLLLRIVPSHAWDHAYWLIRKNGLDGYSETRGDDHQSAFAIEVTMVERNDNLGIVNMLLVRIADHPSDLNI